MSKFIEEFLYQLKAVFTYKQSKSIVKELCNVKKSYDKTKLILFLLPIMFIGSGLLIVVYEYFIKTYYIFFIIVSIISLILSSSFFIYSLKNSTFKNIILSKKGVFIIIIFILLINNLIIAVPEINNSRMRENIKYVNQEKFKTLLKSANSYYLKKDFENAYKNYKSASRFGELTKKDNEILKSLIEYKLNSLLMNKEYKNAKIEVEKIYELYNYHHIKLTEKEMEQIKNLLKEQKTLNSSVNFT